MEKKIKWIVAVLVSLFVNSHCFASNSLSLEAEMGYPVLLSGQHGTDYLKVGLTGFEPADRRCRPVVNMAVVIDKSGSMSGEKIEKAKEAAIMAICRLGPQDIISVVTYDTEVCVLVPATRTVDKESIFCKIRRVTAGGSTALYGGVEKGAGEVCKFLSENHVNRVVLLSDGLANVGPDRPKDLGRLGRHLIKKGISVTTVGLGLGYNEDLMTQLAYQSDGNHYFAENARDLARIFEKEFGKAMAVVAQDVHIKIKCAPGIRPVRLLGRGGTIDNRNVSAFINQIYGGSEKYIILEVEISPEAGEESQKVADVTIKYNNLHTHELEELHYRPTVSFSHSKSFVEKNTNRDVMVNVVELIATERNEMALSLRDKGKIKEAQDLLSSNEQYLHSNATLYNSPQLYEYEQQQVEDKMNMDEGNWTRQRKVMRSNQFRSRTQQSK
ncbi:MAG: vWA domain-containing protein [Planctomycetota bacterium]|jgi:Ca-activated chloride channel family protein